MALFFSMGNWMAKHSFFHSTPYRTLSSKQASDARVYPEVLNRPPCLKASSNQGATNLADLAKARKAIVLSLKVYAPRLADIDPATFKYNNEIQRTALEEELMNTFYLLYDECQLHMAANNLPALRERGTQLERCANLLYRLHNTPPADGSTSCEQAHEITLGASPEKPAKYIALTLIAPLIAETMLGFTSDEGLDEVISMMSAVNLFRLNWVWGGGLDRAILEQIPAGMGHAARASEVFAAIIPFTGYMSWVLYYLRLGINLYLLTKGSLKGSWMDPWRTQTDRDINMGIYERFQIQWDLRKFSILNDTFWATANMACFFWLVGSGTLEYLGNALTLALLGFDLCLTCWRYAEEETRHNQEIEHYRDEINALAAKIDEEKDETKQKVLEEHMDVLHGAHKKCDVEWKFAKQNISHDVLYAAGLMFAFSLLCCFFFPPAALLPATIVILGIAGAALSFAMTIAYHAWKTNTKIQQLQALCTRVEEKITTLDAKNLKLSNPSDNEMFVLERTRLIEELAYRQSMIAHHKKELTQQILSEALVPASAFALLLFLPLSMGLPMLIPVILLLMMSGSILERWKPKNPREQQLLVQAAAPSP